MVNRESGGWFWIGGGGFEGGARAALCYIAARELGLICIFVAKELTISPSAVCKATVRRRRELDHAVIQGLLGSP